MSGRKTRERRSLTKAVKRFRVNVMPYTYCFKSNKVCKIAKESSRYSECIYTGRSQCNKQQKIKEEEQKAKEEIEIL
ncbi:hypothetical protein CSPAE12_01313 [Colletotrichum incanum]|nr:hypothetical protein CSPAE12_01313 [Colletotrichum incanum]